MEYCTFQVHSLIVKSSVVLDHIVKNIKAVINNNNKSYVNALYDIIKSKDLKLNSAIHLDFGDGKNMDMACRAPKLKYIKLGNDESYTPNYS
ncbi:MAG: hypothetical protein ACOCRK_02080 [bacterium]